MKQSHVKTLQRGKMHKEDDFLAEQPEEKEDDSYFDDLLDELD